MLIVGVIDLIVTREEVVALHSSMQSYYLFSRSVMVVALYYLK